MEYVLLFQVSDIDGLQSFHKDATLLRNQYNGSGIKEFLYVRHQPQMGLVSELELIIWLI